MDELLALHRKALGRFGQRVHRIRPGQFGAPTPCRRWRVLDLVGHVVTEQLWAVSLLAMRDLDSAAAGVPADPLDDDPVAAWDIAAAAAAGAFDLPDALAGSVELSSGERVVEDYTSEMIIDLVVHGWDLARAIGDDERLDADLVWFAWVGIEPVAGDLAASGLFDPPVAVASDADLQTRMLALSGRRA